MQNFMPNFLRLEFNAELGVNQGCVSGIEFYFEVHHHVDAILTENFHRDLRE
jgi:hypothetical protein